MKTLGIDLAAGDKNTAACAVVWCDGHANVVEVRDGLVDDELLRWIAQVDKVGIDAPFGWPDAFVAALVARAVVVGATHLPDAAQLERAVRGMDPPPDLQPRRAGRVAAARGALRERVRFPRRKPMTDSAHGG